MEFYHISDLHLGRELNGYDITRDQEYALHEIIQILKERNAAYLLISGDVFDKYNPSNEAMRLYNDFLDSLNELAIKVIIISGNHDSKDKLAYFGSFLQKHNIYVFTSIDRITFDEDKVSFLLFPYFNDEDLLHRFGDRGENPHDIYRSYVEEFLKDTPEDYIKICLCHNLIAGGISSSSERIISVGGVNSLDKSIFDGLDYTALGHLHKIQKISENIRYSGSILKYSTDEFNNINSMLAYDSDSKEVKELPISSLNKYRKLVGKYDEIIENAKTDPGKEEDFVDIVLTDSKVIPNAITELQGYYKKIVSFRNGASSDDFKAPTAISLSDGIHAEDHFSVFHDFYKSLTGEEPTLEELNIMKEIIHEVREEK